jgi:cytosine/uracil/thiamine/allantoin permease
MPSYIVAGVFLLVFTSVKTEILVFDYWIIRKRKWVVPDLFIGGRGHIYWYFHGINPREWFAYIVTTIPSCVSVEIRGLRPLIGLVSPGTERHGAVH